jgi:ATP-dependent protease ClpP protease subunit
LPSQINSFDIETQSGYLSTTDEQTQQIILKETESMAETKLTTKDLKEAFLKTTSFDTSSAKKYGFISKVEQPKLPNDSEVLYLTDQYLSTISG